MPQPLSKVTTKRAISIGSNQDSPSVHRPQLALYAMNVIAEWSILESFIHSLFIKMLGANPGPGAAMLTCLTSTAAQRDAMRAVAGMTMNEKQLEVFEAILSLFTAASKERNRIAHWIWGYHDDLKDAVLLCNPDALMKWNVAAETWTMSAQRARVLLGQEAQERPDLPWDDIFVYRDKDFQAASNKIQRLIKFMTEMRFVMTVGHPANQDGQLLAQLEAEPEVAESLVHLRARRRRSQEAEK